jgi:O-antigen ligase
LQVKSVEIFNQYPLTGIGWDNFRGYDTGSSVLIQDRSGQITISPDGRNPHSVYFTNLAELGLFGTVTFALLLLWLIGTAIGLMRNPETRDQFDFAAVIWLPTYLLIGITHDVGGMFLVLMLAFLYGQILEIKWQPQVNWRFAPRRAWLESQEITQAELTDSQALSPGKPGS